MGRRLLPSRFELLNAVAVLATLGSFIGCATEPSYAPQSISIERFGCLGSCPAYRFTLYSDGRYVWEGRVHVSVRGTVRGSMGAKAYAAAMQLLADARYLEFTDDHDRGECKPETLDLPWVEIVVADATGSKTLTHYFECQLLREGVLTPREKVLTQLEMDLEKVFRTRRFTS